MEVKSRVMMALSFPNNRPFKANHVTQITEIKNMLTTTICMRRRRCYRHHRRKIARLDGGVRDHCAALQHPMYSPERLGAYHETTSGRIATRIDPSPYYSL